MPRVSVITTAYNCETFIEASITSILKQSFSDYEFIIINDGSTDSTGKILSCFNDPRIIYSDYSENKGVMLRSREAITKATGEFIAISDGDDISMPNRLQTQVDFLHLKSSLFCVGSHAKKINVQGNFIGDWDFPPAKHEEVVNMLIYLHKCPIINPTSMFKTIDYHELGGYSPGDKYKGAHDLDFWCRAILAGKKIENIQECLLKYRVNPEGMTRKHKLLQFSDHKQIMLHFLKRIANVKR